MQQVFFYFISKYKKCLVMIWHNCFTLEIYHFLISENHTLNVSIFTCTFTSLRSLCYIYQPTHLRLRLFGHIYQVTYMRLRLFGHIYQVTYMRLRLFGHIYLTTLIRYFHCVQTLQSKYKLRTNLPGYKQRAVKLPPYVNTAT